MTDYLYAPEMIPPLQPINPNELQMQLDADPDMPRWLRQQLAIDPLFQSAILTLVEVLK